MDNNTYEKSIKDYREELNPEDIKEILSNLGIESVEENDMMILYPTVCHNADQHSASHKLYYYKKDKIFKCYTECNQLFDIFQLIMDIFNLRGEQISLKKAIEICGLKADGKITDSVYYSIKKQLNYLYEMNNSTITEAESLEGIDKEIINKYIFDLEYLKSWISEGIAPKTLSKYNIKYSIKDNAITIPYYTPSKELVGIRGRFLSPEAKAKYMPLKHKNKFLSHPTSKVLYGLDINHKAISKKGTVILFEGEKSVLKMDTIYDNDNISLAVSGKNISKEHIYMLNQLGVSEIVLAFDREFLSITEMEKSIEEYKGKVKFMKNFFNVSAIIDEDFLLPYKESPIDMGVEVFEKLMEERIYL